MVRTKTEKATKTSDKSKSKKSKPEWLKTDEKDIETIVLKLAKQDMTSEKIGLALRDNYGIPKTRLLGKKISKILKNKRLYKDAESINLEKKHKSIKEHFEKNKQDKRAQRALTITSAKIKKLKEYRERKEK